MFRQRPLPKTGLLAGLLAALLAGWAGLARSEAAAPASVGVPPTASEQVARALDLELQPVPTLAPLPAQQQPSSSLQQRAPTLRVQTALAAPRPLARSRSSR